MAELNANDKMLLECIRGEFNNQEQDERIRVADFMDYEAATELLRERQHAEAAVQRINRRIAAILEYAGKRRARGVKEAPAPLPLPEFEKVSYGVDSVMRPVEGMAISEYAFRQWAKDVGITLAAGVEGRKP